MHTLELVVDLAPLDPSHCLRADAFEVIVVPSLEAAPALRGVNVVPEVCHQVVVRQVHQHCLVVHHRPVA